jgi:hypothetical protein
LGLRGLPPIRNLERLIALLEKNLEMISKFEQIILSLKQRGLLIEVKQACLEVVENVTILLRGSTAAYASFMDDYFLDGLTKLECNDLLELAKKLDSITEPDDLDWLLSITEVYIDIKVLMRLRTKLISYLEKLSQLNFIHLRCIVPQPLVRERHRIAFFFH